MEACGRILRWWLGAGMEREERSINRTGEREKDNGSCATRSWSMVIGAGRTTPLYSSWHDTLKGVVPTKLPVEVLCVLE